MQDNKNSMVLSMLLIGTILFLNDKYVAHKFFE